MWNQERIRFLYFDEGTAGGSRAARGWGHEGKKYPELREVKEEGGNREG